MTKLTVCTPVNNVYFCWFLQVHDEDFDEYCLPDSISEVPQTGRVKVKARAGGGGVSMRMTVA